ncbi:hypothetical protein XH83_11950 [Bradyrhizobium sp. CCBAU 53351]|uniref:hypothetical protein n=1 Tax=Bradyrhizobium sp. CCBAU 53351 TaxID=1325114 RepID=UPI0018893803|nr:hypothetical protein [Bradyrhizobium sp. CCBAU 53351]QOZ76094.1 hypothetical protein XH83_11950 [Bradyrhizobium sp. CCBAU 53351]
MFDTLVNSLVVLSVGFPAVPWLFGARWGRRGVWFSTGISVVTLLGVFPIVFELGCGACGQGAIAIFLLVPIWIASAMFTVASAAVAHFKFALISAAAWVNEAPTSGLRITGPRHGQT